MAPRAPSTERRYSPKRHNTIYNPFSPSQRLVDQGVPQRVLKPKLRNGSNRRILGANSVKRIVQWFGYDTPRLDRPDPGPQPVQGLGTPPVSPVTGYFVTAADRARMGKQSRQLPLILPNARVAYRILAARSINANSRLGRLSEALVDGIANEAFMSEFSYATVAQACLNFSCYVLNIEPESLLESEEDTGIPVQAVESAYAILYELRDHLDDLVQAHHGYLFLLRVPRQFDGNVTFDGAPEVEAEWIEPYVAPAVAPAERRRSSSLRGDAPAFTPTAVQASSIPAVVQPASTPAAAQSSSLRGDAAVWLGRLRLSSRSRSPPRE